MTVNIRYELSKYIDKIEISLNAVGKAGKLKLAKVAVKRR
jgi:hypothetical protein